jgi:hypothetical protein
MTFADQISTSQIEKQRYSSTVLWADNTQIELSLDEQQIKDIIDETEKDTARIASTLLA